MCFQTALYTLVELNNVNFNSLPQYRCPINIAEMVK